MDVEAEEVCGSDTATACKRQKRTNSKDEEEYENGEGAPQPETATGSKVDPILVGDEANESSTSKNNNNNNKNNQIELEESSQEQKPDEPMKAVENSVNAAIDEASGDGAGAERNSSRSQELSINNMLHNSSDEMPAASEVSCPDPSLSTSTRRSVVDDEEDASANTDSNSRVFRRSVRQRTRTYRHPEHLYSSSDSDGQSNENNNSEINNTDVDNNGGDEVADHEAHTDDESLSQGAHDDSSSGSSVAFWNRYYTSSNEENDSDDEYVETVANVADKAQVEAAVNKVMGKPKPEYNWNFAQELMRREHNLFNRIDWRGGQTSSQSFGQGYYATRQVVERMKLLDSLNLHRCCVNCLSFNRTGDLICSGSDDLCIIIWDWAKGKARHNFKSGHSLNIFQTKFIDSIGCLDIVSSSRDGQVRRAVIPPSGSSTTKTTRLYNHSDAVHKLVIVPQSRHEIMSAGEDAAVKHFDLRSNECSTMLRCVSREDKRRVRLFSIAHHPYMPEFCVSGSDDKLRVYDKRNLSSNAVHEMTPKDLKDVKITQITCAVYNHSGSEILASYSDAGIYLYDSRNYKEGEYLHNYEGHINSRTIKGVNFFGPHSEYIISGSDCGNIFFWDKNTEAVMNFVKGDHAGVVNCLEQHPWMPVLATSGLDHNVKIWAPSGQPEAEVPRTDALKETLQRNFKRSILDVGDFDINQIHYFIRQLIEPRRRNALAVQIPRNRNQVSSSSNSNSSSSSSSHISLNPRNIATEQQEQQRRRRGSQPNSSDEGHADVLGCRSQ